MDSSAPPSSVNPSFEILPTTNIKESSIINFAKEVIFFAFSNNFKSLTDVAGYIGKRFSENYNEEWNCTVWEWNKGGMVFFFSSRIDIKYNNFKIVIWN